ncbi:hypothetical protein B0H12DRAFT_112526 [Mycena haematopus]|nr:hypothetical protein B0H12DRAFT_112526 [Mycena haematopus]
MFCVLLAWLQPIFVSPPTSIFPQTPHVDQLLPGFLHTSTSAGSAFFFCVQLERQPVSLFSWKPLAPSDRQALESVSATSSRQALASFKPSFPYTCNSHHLLYHTHRIIHVFLSPQLHHPYKETPPLPATCTSTTTRNETNS